MLYSTVLLKGFFLYPRRGWYGIKRTDDKEGKQEQAFGKKTLKFLNVFIEASELAKILQTSVHVYRKYCNDLILVALEA